MDEQAQAAEPVSRGAKLTLILLLGALSMFFAEACSGSSVLWFITPWAWMVTFWLYLAHILLFVNLALIFKRTSLTSLYLWGVFFGLYEAWITKVTWAGYIGSSPASGTFLGFAIIEFPLIVLFWHPVMSFIVPILTFEVLSGESRILPEHLSILTKSKRNWLLSGFILIVSALFLSFNAKGDLLAVIMTIVGSIALIAALYFIASKRYSGQFSIESLRLGKIGMTILLIYLALLYLLTFFFLVPERTAPPLTILLTLGIYALIGILLYVNRPGDRAEYPIQEKKPFGRKELTILLIIFFILASVLSLATPADNIAVIISYLAMYVISFILLAIAVVNVLKSHRRSNKPAS